MLGDRVKALRREYNLSQEDLAKIVGVHKQVISQYERGQRRPGSDTLSLLAKALKVSTDYLLGNSDIMNPYGEEMFPASWGIRPVEKKSYPILGEISCGEPILMNEEREVYSSPVEVKADFILTARGDSMIGARIQDGDIVFIRKQRMVENGEIAAVAIGDECLLKRFYMEKDVVTLVSENPKYPPKIYMGVDLESIRILGKAVAFQSVV